MTMCALLLQKPGHSSKSKDHMACLERRMLSWQAGELDDLLDEGSTIQSCLTNPKKRRLAEDGKTNKRAFLNEMSKGNTKAALRLLSKDNRGSVLHLSHHIPLSSGEQTTVLDVLKSNHPPGSAPSEDSILDSAHNPSMIHLVGFDGIHGKTICSATLHTNGAAGPSGIDVHGWKRMCTSFSTASDNLCHALDLLTRQLCKEFVDPESLTPLLSCRLVALDKNPGVHPIGICEVARRIIAKTILTVTSGDIQDAAGLLQLCAGQKAGAEAAVHAMN